MKITCAFLRGGGKCEGCRHAKAAKWVTVKEGFWRTYDSKIAKQGFVEYPRYPGDDDQIARVQVLSARRPRKTDKNKRGVR